MRRQPPPKSAAPAYPTADGVARNVAMTAALSAVLACAGAGMAADVVPAAAMPGEAVAVVCSVVDATVIGYDASTRVLSVVVPETKEAAYTLPAGVSIAAAGKPGTEADLTAGRAVRLSLTGDRVTAVQVDPQPAQPVCSPAGGVPVAMPR